MAPGIARRLLCSLSLGAVAALALAVAGDVALAQRDPGAAYAAEVRRVARRREHLAERWAAAHDRRALVRLVAGDIASSVRALTRHWLGTRWGLGPPQASRPGGGKINCGTFVGTVLRDAGFAIDVARLQRQPSQLIIRSFTPLLKRWSRAPMARFLADMRAMGPGLYIVGLDVHVGLLLQTSDDLRFIHASYVTRTVVDEPAATASPIVDSGYRVVGKLLGEDNVRSWIEGREIEVRGHW